jgi:hypothetical protein
MRRTASLFMALGAFALSIPAWPGALYIPVVDAVNGNGTTLSTQLWIINPAATQRRANLTFLPENTNGTVRINNPGVGATVAAKGSFRVNDTGANGRVGMLEVDLVDVNLLQAVRLAKNSADLSGGGANVPVVSSENLVPANGIADLVGLMHVNHQIRTDVGIMNLGQSAAQCSVSLFRADGTQIGSKATLTFAPLSMRHFPDPLIDQVNVTDIRAEISCNQPFYAYATVHGANGQVEYFITPALSGSSTLLPPGGTTPPKGCGTGAVCYDFAGVVHVPTTSKPDRAIILSPPSGTYNRVKVHMEVQINGWNPTVTAAHGLLYMVRDKNKDMFASAFLKGPGANQLALRYGFNLSAKEKPKLTTGFAPVLGQTYAFDYLWDPAGQSLVLTMSTLGGQELARITSKPNVDKVQIGQNQKIVIGLSNPGTEASEPASIGFIYKNLHVELIP